MLRRLPVCLATALALLAPLTAAAPSHAAGSQHTTTTLSSEAQWGRGVHNGTTVSNGSLRVSRGVNSQTRNGVPYDVATWTSPWIGPSHTFSQVVPSWEVATPDGTAILMRVRPRTTTGSVGAWKNLGLWANSLEASLHTSAGSQSDAISKVATDTLVATGTAFDGYQIQAVLLRHKYTQLTPTVRALHGVASQIGGIPTPTSRVLPAKTLAVPEYSQMIHRGEYPQYGNGGEAWCSPTSLAMVLDYYDALPPASHYGWVDNTTDPWVDEVARRTYDYEYEGTGNWPFNTAYAATRGLHAKVSRLRDLTEAEQWIAKGVPLVASIAFSSGQLDGAPISSTAGHLVVISGFTRAGKVVVNDPAAANNAGVRRVYDRAQFEAAWQRSSHGVVYVLHR